MSNLCKKVMKVFLIIGVIVIGIFLLVGIAGLIQGDIYKNDLEKYKNGNEFDSSIGITAYKNLLPSASFLHDYAYIQGEYHYYSDEVFLSNKYEISLISLWYEEDVYLKAKEYALKNMNLSTKNKYFYNNYEFIENLTLPMSMYPKEYEYFPNHFTMFCYNDSKNILIFMGYYYFDIGKDDVTMALTNWGTFIKKYYSEYYDFDN